MPPCCVWMIGILRRSLTRAIDTRGAVLASSSLCRTQHFARLAYRRPSCSVMRCGICRRGRGLALAPPASLLLLGLHPLFQPAQRRLSQGYERRQPLLLHVSQRCRVEAIVPLASILTRLDEPRIAQHSQVPRHGRPADPRERRRDFARRQRLGSPQDVQDGAARRIGERVEDCVTLRQLRAALPAGAPTSPSPGRGAAPPPRRRMPRIRGRTAPPGCRRARA